MVVSAAVNSTASPAAALLIPRSRRGHEVGDERGDLRQVGFEGEVAGVEQVQLGLGQVP
ncbi:hypothetical protein [Planomonospora parontospora]|uniref:hypothetical protein n=1 Tax=Planomonospora parontospora TaxID=58119 RepID=UPI00177C3F14|nr:hypothetical protein [Planomonospora parontospora]